MAEYEVDGTIYEFPDDMPDEEVLSVLRGQGILPTVREPGVIPAAEVQPADVVAPMLSAEEVVQGAEQAALAGQYGRTPEQQAEAVRKAREEAQKRTEALVSPGGRVDLPEPADGEPGWLQSVYKSWFPESQENIDAVLSRQPVMTAQALAEAKARSREGGKPMAEYLPDVIRLSTQGVETPLGATVRVVGDSIAGAAEVAVREGLGYEVDPATGLPLDPEDRSYRAQKAIESLIGEEDYPATLAVGGLLGIGPIGKAYKTAFGIDVDEKLEAAAEEVLPEWAAGFLLEGIAVPTFGPVDTGSAAARETDPYGFRVADSRLDWNDQIVRNARVGRTMKDLFVDMPEVRKAYKETYGSESAAYYGGALADMAIPDLTFVGGKASKLVKGAGGLVDGGLSAIAGSRLFGGKAAREAMGALKTGEDVIARMGDVVAREAVGPRALYDAVLTAQDAGEAVPDLVRLAERVAPGSKSAAWMAKRAEQVGLRDALLEMRLAQSGSDLVRVFDAAVAGAKKGQDAIEVARKTALRLANQIGDGFTPASVEAAINAANSTKGLSKALTDIVPETASVISVGSPGSGSAVRAILNKADEALEGVGAVTAREQVAEMARKALGEMVPRDMVAVTSKVMVPRRVADGLRKAVDAALKGTIEAADGAGFRVVQSKAEDVADAINRVYPRALRSGFWDDMEKAVREGRVLRPDQTARLTDALQTDAYLRLARDPKTGRALAEGLANVGKELDAATGGAFQRAWSRNIGRRILGTFGKAKGAPAIYSEMGRRIGKETFGIPKRVADSLRAAQKAGADDPFEKVARDLAAGSGRLADNFIEEAWQNALTPLYGPLAGPLKRLPEVRALMNQPPSLAALRRVDDIASSQFTEVSDGFLKVARKDFGKALFNGLIEAEAWVTARKVAQEMVEDNPGFNISLAPGVRGLPVDEVKKLTVEALTSLVQQGTTYGTMMGRYAGPMTGTGLEDFLRKQGVMDAVGSALRAYGVKALEEGLDDNQIAQRIASDILTWVQTPEGLDAVLIIPQGDSLLRRLQELDGMPNLAEAVNVVKRSGTDLDKQTFSRLSKGFGDWARATVDLVAANEPTRMVKATFGPAIAVLAKQGAAKALETTLGVVTDPVRRLGKGLDTPLFTAGGRPWTQRALNDEAARLGVGASTRLSAARRGQLANDLMADLMTASSGNKVFRGAQQAGNIVSRVGRFLPSLVDKVEQAFRREVFAIALKEGRSPDEAARMAADAVLEFEPTGTDFAARSLQPVIAAAVTGVAGLESLVARPQETMRILRGIRYQQDYVDRTYGGDQNKVGFNLPLIGQTNLYGPAAAGWLANTLADVYYMDGDGWESFLRTLAGGIDPLRQVGKFAGGVSTWIDGEPSSMTRDDEVMQVMLMASLADRWFTDPTGITPLQPWDVLVDRYGLEATNIDPKTGGRTRIPIGKPARKGVGPRGGAEAWYTYKMSPEGRKQFKEDMEWAKQGGGDLLLEAYKMYGVQDVGVAQPEARLPAAERRMGEEVREATGR